MTHTDMITNDGTSFKDYFSHASADYSSYRPTYPPELFAWLAAQTTHHATAWDCGCGSGQASIELVNHYQQVVATDPSQQQIASANHHERISYHVATAEQSGLDAASVDLVVVAQALHWFDFDRFYGEVRRVAAPGSVLAAITYGEVRVDGDPGPVISDFYHTMIGPYWPPERRHVDALYESIPFPFPGIPAPAFSMDVTWDLAQLTGYLSTWSAVKEFERLRGTNPLDLIWDRLTAAWGEPSQARHISWPLTVKAGRVA